MTTINYNTVGYIYNNIYPYTNDIEPNTAVLICRAYKGPILVPIKITSEIQCAEIYGIGSEAYNAFIEYSNNTTQPVYIIRINGNPIEKNLEDANQKALISIRCLSPQLNKLIATVDVLEDAIIIICHKNEQVITYEIELYENITIDEIVQEINYVAKLGAINIYAVKLGDGTLAQQAIKLIDLDFKYIDANTIDEQSIDAYEYYDRLNIVFNNLLNNDVRNIGLVYSNFPFFKPKAGHLYTLINNFAMQKFKDNIPCVITVGIDTIFDIRNLDRLLSDNFESLTDYHTNTGGKVLSPTLELSEFINIVIARFTVANTNSNYVSNGVPSYCAMIQEMHSDGRISGKSVKGALKNLVAYTNDQVINYRNKGYVVFRNDDDDIKVYDAVNCLYKTDGATFDVSTRPPTTINKCKCLKHLSNVLFLCDFVRTLSASLPIPQTELTQDAIEVAILNTLSEYSNIIKSSKYQIFNNIEKFDLSYYILVELVLYGEVQAISVNISSK